MGRSIDGFIPVNANIKAPAVFDVDSAGSGAGVVSAALNGIVTVVEHGDESLHQTVLTLTDVPQTVVNGVEYQGTLLYSFPKGRMVVLGVTASLAQKTTSTIASTLHSASVGALSLGTATASSVTLASTMADFLASTAFASSTAINTAGTAVGGLLATTSFDGHTTAKNLYLNTAYATTADVAADATQTVSGTITVTWVNLGIDP